MAGEKILYKFRWVCRWTNRHGCFHPDFEMCTKHGRFVENCETAIKKGTEHNNIHEFAGYGYPYLGWKNKSVYIERKSIKMGKTKIIMEL